VPNVFLNISGSNYHKGKQEREKWHGKYHYHQLRSLKLPPFPGFHPHPDEDHRPHSHQDYTTVTVLHYTMGTNPTLLPSSTHLKPSQDRSSVLSKPHPSPLQKKEPLHFPAPHASFHYQAFLLPEQKQKKLQPQPFHPQISTTDPSHVHEMTEGVWISSCCLHTEGFPKLLYATMQRLGIQERPKYEGREYEEHGTERCEVTIYIAKSEDFPDIAKA
jgi:hypothetical protein